MSNGEAIDVRIARVEEHDKKQSENIKGLWNNYNKVIAGSANIYNRQGKMEVRMNGVEKATVDIKESIKGFDKRLDSFFLKFVGATIVIVIAGIVLNNFLG